MERAVCGRAQIVYPGLYTLTNASAGHQDPSGRAHAGVAPAGVAVQVAGGARSSRLRSTSPWPHGRHGRARRRLRLAPRAAWQQPSWRARAARCWPASPLTGGPASPVATRFLGLEGRDPQRHRASSGSLRRLGPGWPALPLDGMPSRVGIPRAGELPPAPSSWTAAASARPASGWPQRPQPHRAPAVGARRFTRAIAPRGDAQLAWRFVLSGCAVRQQGVRLPSAARRPPPQLRPSTRRRSRRPAAAVVVRDAIAASCRPTRAGVLALRDQRQRSSARRLVLARRGAIGDATCDARAARAATGAPMRPRWRRDRSRQGVSSAIFVAGRAIAGFASV